MKRRQQLWRDVRSEQREEGGEREANGCLGPADSKLAHPPVRGTPRTATIFTTREPQLSECSKD
ncbi:hypothetical protein E2C01_082763 [Portunus trituberculatus]|uniref:Uncharacterized protein n=1 Tax=Portunus trituberculatus TaxID=210409 RepID=A0A5B7J056_PORTR|nr:hypothetical protein [Portunus trituberculatus]